MVVVRIIVKIVLLPVRICLTMIQLVVMFFTWLSATVFHILSGIICITAECFWQVLYFISCCAFWLGSGVAGNNQNQIDEVDHWRKE